MDNKDEKNKLGKIFSRPLFVWVAIICAIMLLMNLDGGGAAKSQSLDIRQLQNELERDSLVEVSIENQPNSGKDWYLLRGKMKNPVAGTAGAPKDAPQFIDFVFEGRITEDVYKKLTDPKSTWRIIEKPSGSFWGTLFINILPIILLVGFIYFIFMRQMRASGKSAMGFAKSKARLMNPAGEKVTFADVAGCEEVKEEVSEIVEFLKNPQRFHDIGARIPRGVLMEGPPGTGKTLLARAVAGEADVPFYSVSGSDFVEMFVGVGAARIRDMFEQARKNSPCIVFIDEIDAVGRQRGAGLGGGHDEKEQTLNSLLVEMDGFDKHSGVIIIAATNRVDVLDPALLRPGRFDRQVVIDLPDIKGREEILKVHAKKIKLAENVNLGRVAKITPMCSGADLANLLNEGAIIAARRGEKLVKLEDIEEARDKIFFGKERKKLMDESELRLTAYHEAGHALIQAFIDDGKFPLHKVTIIPRGQALGATMFMPSRDIHTSSKSELLNSICTSMGGRVAEEIVFGEITNGAAGDIKQATKTARRMVCAWGMSDMGPIFLGESQEPVFVGREITRHDKNISDKTAQIVDEKVSSIVEEQLERARKIISENRDKLDSIVDELLKNETIDGEVVYKIVLGKVPEYFENMSLSEKKIDADEPSQNSETLENSEAEKPSEDSGVSSEECAPNQV